MILKTTVHSISKGRSSGSRLGWTWTPRSWPPRRGQHRTSSTSPQPGKYRTVLVECGGEKIKTQDKLLHSFHTHNIGKFCLTLDLVWLKLLKRESSWLLCVCSSLSDLVFPLRSFWFKAVLVWDHLGWKGHNNAITRNTPLCAWLHDAFIDWIRIWAGSWYSKQKFSGKQLYEG